MTRVRNNRNIFSCWKFSKFQTVFKICMKIYKIFMFSCWVWLVCIFCTGVSDLNKTPYSTKAHFYMKFSSCEIISMRGHLWDCLSCKYGCLFIMISLSWGDLPVRLSSCVVFLLWGHIRLSFIVVIVSSIDVIFHWRYI